MRTECASSSSVSGPWPPWIDCMSPRLTNRSAPQWPSRRRRLCALRLGLAHVLPSRFEVIYSSKIDSKLSCFSCREKAKHRCGEARRASRPGK